MPMTTKYFERLSRGCVIVKKFLISILALVMVFPFWGCNTDPNAETYNRACGLFIDGKYTEAKAIYESLSDYSNSIEMAKKCDEKEIERLLQGRWEVPVMEPMPSLAAEFKDGIFSFLIIGEEKDTVWSTGVYWIDFDSQLIYICNDITDDSPVEFNITVENQNVYGEVANITGYTKYCTYTFNDGKLELSHVNKEYNLTYVKQETTQ